MSQVFRLYWLRETGCDAGTPVRGDDLEPEIKDQVLALAQDTAGAEEIILRLPFLDKTEWPRRGRLLAGLRWQRDGNEISPVLRPNSALRNQAAHLVLADPAWANTPEDRDISHFRVWQRVSMTLQKSMRAWTAEAFFRDVSRYEDRATANSVLVYEATRVWHGKPRTEFTYDFRDYPERNHTLALSMKLTTQSLQDVLTSTERRLSDAGMPLLAHRYSPVWYEDILRQVRRKPRKFVRLLANECIFINAVIDLGSDRTAAGVNRFARTAGQSLRSVYGMDLRFLGLRALHQATQALQSVRDGMVEESDSLPQT